jgi:hypothetical protein
MRSEHERVISGKTDSDIDGRQNESQSPTAAKGLEGRVKPDDEPLEPVVKFVKEVVRTVVNSAWPRTTQVAGWGRRSKVRRFSTMTTATYPNHRSRAPACHRSAWPALQPS